MNQTNVIHIQNLKKRFGSHEVLKGVSFSLAQGKSLALLGRNGAGKTTIIQSMMGLQDIDEGTLEVLGISPNANPLGIRRLTGYLAEDQQMYGWMSVGQLVRFVSAFYPTWDHAMANRLLVEYGLHAKQKVRNLSKGQNIRLGLLLALAQNAQLLVLDDPALALDPIMRKEFNRSLLAHIQEKQTSLLYSSHLLSEVEAVADQIAILHEGKIIQCDDVDNLRERIKKIILPEPDFQKIKERLHILDISHSDQEVALVIDQADTALNILSEWDIEPQILSLNLDEIFEACVMGQGPTFNTEQITTGV